MDDFIKELHKEYQGVYKFNDRVIIAYDDNGSGATYDIYIDEKYTTTVRTLEDARNIANQHKE